jgi:hypothetical protein
MQNCTFLAPASKLLKTSSSTTLVKSNTKIPERIVLRADTGNRLIIPMRNYLGEIDLTGSEM